MLNICIEMRKMHLINFMRDNYLAIHGYFPGSRNFFDNRESGVNY
jgi:hypothetical protein